MTSENKPGFWNTWIARFKSIVLTALCHMVLFNASLAQSSIPVKTYLSDSYYEEDGLASNLVYEMAQSTDGLMWFVTQKGISTFDGLRWETSDYEISPNAGNNVRLIALQDGSMLLAGSTSQRIQLAHYNNHKWQPLELPTDLVIKDDTQILSYTRVGVTQSTPNQYLISIIYKDKLYLYNSADSSWQNYQLPEEINKRSIGRLFFFENKLLICALSGLASFDLNTGEFDMNPIPEIAGKAVRNITTSADGKVLYILGNNFVGQYKQNRYISLVNPIYSTEPETPTYLAFHNILADRNNRLYFNHNSALFKYNLSNHSLEQVKLDNARAEFIPSDIFEDKEGNIWFSNLRGIKKVSSFRFYSPSEYNEFYPSEVSTILQLDTNAVLLAGNHDIKTLINNELKQRHTFSRQNNNTSSNRVLDAIKTPKGQVYLISNRLGLGELQTDSTIRWYNLPGNQLSAAVAWHQDSLVVANNLGTLLYFNQKNRTFTPIRDKIHGLYIRKIISKDGALILLTTQGVYKTTEQSTTHIKSKKLQQQNIYSYLEWKGHTLLGTMGGLCELVDGQIVKITHDSLRLDRPVYAMLEDAKGRLWTGTDKGIYIQDKGNFLHYGPQQGLSGTEINRAAFEQMSDGSIWIGTDQGFSVYNPEDDLEPELFPEVRITKVSAQGEELDRPEQALAYDRNTLEFQFQTITFYQPGTNKYRYMLEGLDEHWVHSDNHLTNQVRYTNLPPGSYTFVIQARSGNGDWSEAVRSSSIRIQPPFYNTWWFILLVLAGIGSLGYMAHALISNKQNERRLRQAIEDKKAALEESEKRFRAVWVSTDTSFVLTNRQGRILMANPSFCRLMKIAPEQACEIPIGTLIPDPVLYNDKLEQVYDQKTVYRSQVVTRLQHQTRYLMATITSINQQLHEEPLLLIGFKDDTEQKRAEESNTRLNEELIRQNMALLKKEDELANYNHELLQQREELEQALRAVEERNYQLDQFVYKTSHDLRAPISSALGLINITRMDPDYSRWPQYLELIDGSLKKQDTFIKAMLSFSKTTRATNKSELIDFQELITHCLEELQTLGGFTEVEQLIEVRQEGEVFYSDRMKLYIILSNIISNSIKYRDTFKKSFLQIEVKLNSRGAEITISDNGIGIADKYQQQIFDMFFKATERSDGSGLGLYIVKQTVEKLHGHIITDSELGRGSRFKIFIPNQYTGINTQVLAGHKEPDFNRSATS